MRKGLTEMIFVLDRSGSMSGLESDTIGGFNSMIDKQKKENGEALVSTVLFDDTTEVIHDRVKLEDVARLTDKEYYARGCTALFDALGGAVKHISDVHKYIRDEDIPEKTVCVVITDGMENASKRFSRRKLQELIREKKEKYGWEFMFLGANIDAESTAVDMGMDADDAADFVCDERGMALNCNIISETVSHIRACAARPRGWNSKIKADFAARNKK